ncbi:unnamed protein product [Urochloa decumbens]|uniref:DHFR domain-containing protein n=1 Tax=Urochloa decumbens TaxID=240449 RepID=A0ABC9B376_9POAL
MDTAPANGDSYSGLQRNYQVVVAATRDLGIGKDGVLPWKLLGDLKFFKELTLSTSDPAKKNAVIMGRKTWESIPVKWRPLPGPLNVILTRSGSFDFATVENVVICGSMKSALEMLASTPYCLSIERVFVIGGGQVLREFLNGPACEAIHLTDVQSTIECDTFIPPIDFSVFQPWYSSFPVVESNIRHSFVTIVRVRQSLAKTHDSNGKESTEVDSKNDKFETENFSFLPKMIFDRHEEYHDLNLVEDIIRSGAQKNDRTGTGTLSKFGCQMRFNLRKSFPLLTTKRVFWRGVVEELLWFISGSTNAKVLQERVTELHISHSLTWYQSSRLFWILPPPAPVFTGELPSPAGDGVFSSPPLPFAPFLFPPPPPIPCSGPRLRPLLWPPPPPPSRSGRRRAPYCSSAAVLFQLAPPLSSSSLGRHRSRSDAGSAFWLVHRVAHFSFPNGVHIWDGNASREYLDSVGLAHREEGDLGPVYGFQWRHFGAQYTDMHADYTGKGFDQLMDVIDKIKNNPDDRRIILSAWNPSDLKTMALPPCHMFAQFYVENGELSCQMYQRSADMGLGVPFNIASYSLLTYMIAQVCDLSPGDFVHTPKPFPILKINPSKKDIDSFKASDFKLVGYDPHQKIEMKMAV